MKYIAIIVLIVTAVTGLSLLIIYMPEEKEKGDIALTINGYNVSDESVQLEKERFGYPSDNKETINDTIITQKLLVQEAQRLAIDKEEEFRKALKTYYENSLIKVLLERKNSEIEVNVSEADIDRFVSFSGKFVSFTRLDNIPVSGTKVLSAKGQKNTALFDDLADPVKLLLSSLKPGEFGIRFDTGNEKYGIRLDSIDSTASNITSTYDRDQIHELLEEYQREQYMSNWLGELRNNASITINNK